MGSGFDSHCIEELEPHLIWNSTHILILFVVTKIYYCKLLLQSPFSSPFLSPYYESLLMYITCKNRGS